MSLNDDHLQWDSLVDKQLLLWKEKKKKQREGEIELVHPCDAAHLTISRTYGARGYRIGEMVAEKLHWEVYSRSLIEYVADRSNLRHKVIEAFDEKKKTRTLSQTLFEPSAYSSDKHYRHLVQVILSLADLGRAVFIGRGANFITDRHTGLHVHVTASLDSRIERYANQQKISFKEARKKVESVDKERADYIRHYFHQDITAPHHYDLVINVEHFTNEQVAAIIISALEIKVAATCPEYADEDSLTTSKKE